jgi:exopolyphosphatase/guanosine-5'-triphosphate,3'-diphosphate pyrophosphatase
MQIAAIDIGTNSVHMIVVRLRPDLSFEVIDREKDMVRLGAGGLGGGELTASAMSAAMQTLMKFRRLAESHGVDEIIASATSAVRESANGAKFIGQVYRATGIRIRVISGTEEARLIHLAAAYATGIGARTGVVIDIGGGSVEITAGTAARMQSGRSFKLGVIRLTEKFVTTDPLSGREERRMVRAIRRETRTFIAQLRRRGFDRVIGTSGTVLTLGELAAGRRRTAGDVRNLRISAKAVHRLRERLTDEPLAGRLKMPGLDPRRADLCVAGAVLLDTLLEELRAEDLTLCDFALREGLVLDYIKRNRAHIQQVERYPDVRRRSVIELGERCNFVADHARQVARLALQLFDQLQASHGLGARERELLEYAALLHDVGTHISYEKHHKHSYYLIKNGDLRGFEPAEVDIIALVARYHRQSPPSKSHEGFADLSRRARQVVKILGAILRLAEGLDRSHAHAISGLRMRRAAGKQAPWTIRLQSGGDAELEIWAAHRHVAELAALLKRPIEFELNRAPTKGGVLHAQHSPHSPQLSRKTVRRRRHRRIGQDDAARPARKVAQRRRPSRVRH